MLQQGRALLCPNPPQELLSAEEGAVAVGVLVLGFRPASVVLALWIVFTGVLSCLRSLCAASTAQTRKEPKITRSDFSRFSFAYQPALAVWQCPGTAGGSTFTVNSQKYSTVAADLSHIGMSQSSAHPAPKPTIWKVLDSQSSPGLVLTLQHLLLLCSGHRHLCLNWWRTWAPALLAHKRQTKAEDGCAAAQRRGRGCLHSRNAPLSL